MALCSQTHKTVNALGRSKANKLANTFMSVGAGFLVAAIFSLSPVNAQDAAFDAPGASPAYTGGAGMMPGSSLIKSTRPMSTSAAAENKSNLRHWQSFTQASSSPQFVRVPAGMLPMGAQKTTHYRMPKHILPGTKAEKRGGAVVKRYLAYNLPAGAFVKQSKPAASHVAFSGNSSANSAKNSGASKSSSHYTSGSVLSYSAHSAGVIINSAVPRHSGVYATYH